MSAKQDSLTANPAAPGRADLLPCPGCNSRHIAMERGHDDDGVAYRDFKCWWRRCQACRWEGPPGKTKKEADELWNRRPAPEASDERWAEIANACWGGTDPVSYRAKQRITGVIAAMLQAAHAAGARGAAEKCAERMQERLGAVNTTSAVEDCLRVRDSYPAP